MQLLPLHNTSIQIQWIMHGCTAINLHRIGSLELTLFWRERLHNCLPFVTFVHPFVLKIDYPLSSVGFNRTDRDHRSKSIDNATKPSRVFTDMHSALRMYTHTHTYSKSQGFVLAMGSEMR